MRQALRLMSGGSYVIGDFYGQVATFGSYTASNTNSFGTSQDIFLAKLEVLPTSIRETSYGEVQAYPCPFTDVLFVSYASSHEWKMLVCDASGRTVVEQCAAAGTKKYVSVGNNYLQVFIF